MKHSGIPWIGEIPKDWKIERLKQKSDFLNGYAFNSDDFRIDEGVRVIRIGDIGLKVDFDNCVRAITDKTNLTPFKIKDGDILIAMSGATTGKCCIVDKAEEAYANQRVGIIRSNINGYVYYSLQTPYFMEFVNLNNAGSAQPNISSKDIGEFPILSMPFSEQQKIASYLDKKCSEIDEMVVLQEKIIEELKAYKQSVITEAVTKGLNPDVPMKDSGIEWIGEIPENWEVKRLKNVFRLKTGTTPDGYDVMGEGDKISWFTPSDISDECNELYCSERSLLKSAVGDVELFPLGSIMFVGIGASAGKLGYAQIEGYSNQQITALIPNGVNGKYFYYFLIADKRRLKDNAFFTTLPIINNGYLSQNKVICPPSSTQNKVVEYLDNKCTEIDNLISIKQSKIESLKEYKKSIIYEYVTGKKEVI